MKEIQRKWDLIAKEKRESCIDSIIAFFKEERGEEVGMIAAEEVLDFFLEEIGTEIYNKGVEDSKELLKKRCEDLEIDLNLLLNR